MFSKVMWVGRARALVLGLAMMAAVLAAGLLMLAMSPPSNAVERKPDLTIAKIGPSQLFVGEMDFYDVVVTNEGPGSATVPAGTVLLKDTLTGSTYNSAGYNSPYSASFDDNLTTVSYATTTDDTIRPGQTRYFTVMPRPRTTTGTITNTAQVDPDGAIAEADETNNTSATITTNVMARPASDLTVNLALELSDHPDRVRVGRTLTYTLDVTNNGPDVLPPGAYIHHTLSRKVKLSSVEFTQGSGECVFLRFTDYQMLKCRVGGAIGVGESVQAQIRVVPKREGRLETSANAQAGGQYGDPVVVHPGGYPSDTETTKVISRR
jgi:uncharacterized repeat protein (TIGR01451 family)